MEKKLKPTATMPGKSS